MDELVRRSLGDARRLYALSTAYAQDERYFLALRILKRHFLSLARSAPPTVPRAFWDVYYPLGWRAELTDAASRASVDPFLVAAVVREESSFDPQARSRVGARGLMQLMPDTARQLVKGRSLPSGDDMLVDPAANLALGSAYLATLMKEFGEPVSRSPPTTRDPRACASGGRGGPATMSRPGWSSFPFDETRFFVRRVMLSWERVPPPLRHPDRGRPAVTERLTAGLWSRLLAHGLDCLVGLAPGCSARCGF